MYVPSGNLIGLPSVTRDLKIDLYPFPVNDRGREMYPTGCTLRAIYP